MIKSFPKIFSIGQDYIKSIFDTNVEITEKIDGSQFCFGKINDELYMRSKGQQQFAEKHDKMFSKAISYVLSIQDKIPNNTVYFCEYLQNPGHNILKYGRVPQNNLILFGISDTTEKFISKYDELKVRADELEIETVPLLFYGKIETSEDIKQLLETDSILGETKIEGMVVKNYDQPFLLGGQPIPLMSGKFVSESFKETHRDKWGSENTARGKWQTFLDSFRTEARWEKSIQHLKEKGEIENSPKDIGKLIKEIQEDVENEEKEDIKNFLWKEFGNEVLRKSTSGFPEWYKEKLLKDNFV
jgi:hypothetical protein